MEHLVALIDFSFKLGRILISCVRPTMVYLFSFMWNPIQATLLLIGSSTYLYIFKIISGKKINKSIFWRKHLRNVFKIWKLHGSIWNGYEISGLENIPENKPALLIFFHASFLPVDMMYLVANVFLKKNRLIKAIADKDMFNKIGLETLIEAAQVMPGNIDECVKILKSNQLVAISPGGVRESLFSENYKLLWGNRCGFAKIAIEAKIPIIPIFTKNSQEAMKIPHFLTRWMRGFYETFRLLCVGPIGWFPVKLKTIIGEPIEFVEGRKVDELVNLTREKLEKLIADNQKVPSSIYEALLERIK